MNGRRFRAAVTALCLSMACGAASSASPLVGAFRFDPTHTFVTFEVLHFDTATMRGRFGPLDGQAEFDAGSGRGRVQVIIDVSQVSTGLPVLDQLLRGTEFFDAARHPQAFFVAESVRFDAQGQPQLIQGEFTLRGVSVALTLRAERFRCYLNPLLRREVCGGDFAGELRRSDFGITHSLPFVSDGVRLKVQVEGIRQP